MTCCDPLFDNCLFFIYSLKSIKSEIKFSSNLPTPARWKNDEVNQQLKELNMKKLKLLVVRPSDDKKTIYKNLIKYLEQQGIRIVKGGKNEK